MLLISQIGIWKAKLSESEPLAPVIRKRCELQYIAVFFLDFLLQHDLEVGVLCSSMARGGSTARSASWWPLRKAGR